MKALKAKIVEELKKHEHRASLSESGIRRDTLDEVYKLAKTLCYLEKAEHIIDGTYTHEAAPVSATGRKSAMD